MDKALDLVKGFVTAVVVVTIMTQVIVMTGRLFTYRPRNPMRHFQNIDEEQK